MGFWTWEWEVTFDYSFTVLIIDEISLCEAKRRHFQKIKYVEKKIPILANVLLIHFDCQGEICAIEFRINTINILFFECIWSLLQKDFNIYNT